MVPRQLPFETLEGCILTKGTVYQTEGAVLAVFCLGYQHPGHEGRSPLGEPSDTLQ